MTRSMRAVTFLLTVGIAIPAIAGQAVPRPSGTATASSGSSGSSGSGSGGGSAGSSSSGSSGATDASGRSAFGGESRSTPSRVGSGSSSRTGTAAARPAPAPGGVASGGAEAVASGSSSNRTGSDLSQGFGGDPSYARTRNGRPITGSAAVRPFGTGGGGGGDYVSFPFYGPWGQWYPWYGGFGWNMGWLTYDPWRYGATRWYMGPYGMWYDPYDYWDPFWNVRGGGGYYSGSGEREPRVAKTTGSVRIKSNAETGKVYIDGALVGTVDEFDGLNEGLEIEAGRHTLEIRAEGYVTRTMEITVKVGTKKTERINLDQKK